MIEISNIKQLKLPTVYPAHIVLHNPNILIVVLVVYERVIRVLCSLCESTDLAKYNIYLFTH
jgi:hypothetical protein